MEVALRRVVAESEGAAAQVHTVDSCHSAAGVGVLLELDT